MEWLHLSFFNVASLNKAPLELIVTSNLRSLIDEECGIVGVTGKSIKN